LNRVLVNPDNTFKDLLGKTDSTKPASSLSNVFAGSTYAAGLSRSENFVCENIYQFSVTFHVQVTDTTSTPAVQADVPVTIGTKNKSFTIQGTGILTDQASGAYSLAQIAAGRVTAVEISVTVISDFGIDQLRTRTFSDSQKSEFLAKNSYDFTKLVQIPSM
jgi:hypothetical protein